jgi:hypothetical protein
MGETRTWTPENDMVIALVPLGTLNGSSLDIPGSSVTLVRDSSTEEPNDPSTEPMVACHVFRPGSKLQPGPEAAEHSYVSLYARM